MENFTQEQQIGKAVLIATKCAQLEKTLLTAANAIKNARFAAFSDSFSDEEKEAIATAENILFKTAQKYDFQSVLEIIKNQ